MNIRARAEAARNVAGVTCPASRHVQLMAESLWDDGRCRQMEDEPIHCAESMLTTVADLWEKRAQIHTLELTNDSMRDTNRSLANDLAAAQGKARIADECYASLRQELADCKPYVKDGETVTERLARYHKEVTDLMGQLAAAQARIQALEQDAERVDWLEARCHDSGYKIDFGMVRDPAVMAGVTRIQCRVGVGSGPWMKIFEGNKVRFAIDAARKEEA